VSGPSIQRSLLPDDDDDDSPQSASDAARPAAIEQSPPNSGNLTDATVYVVDAHSLIFQVFHALPEMTGAQGQQVGAVYGFTRDILFLLEKKQPDYLFVAFDLSGPVFRHEVFPEYKIQREEMPAELRPQIELIQRLLEAMQIATISYESHEADDVMATLARQVEQRGGRCLLVTGDKDCRQLITDRVQIYNIRKDQVFDAESLAADWGIRPEQVVDFQALVGDSVDNVPGVPLIGPKIASQLLGKYGTLEGVLDHAHEISGAKRKQNLLQGREQALISKRLVRLVDDLPLEIDWSRGRVAGLDQEAVLPLFREFGFRTFAEQIGNLDTAAAPKTWAGDYECVSTPGQLDDLIAEMSQQSRISLDTETTDVDPCRAEIVGYSFAWREGQAWYVPVRAPAGEACLDPDDTLARLKPILEDPAIEKIGQNLKYDAVVLRTAGATLRGIAFDTMVAHYLLDSGSRSHGMDELSKRYLNHQPISIKELIGSGKNQKRMDEVPLAEITPYAAEDADIPLRLEPILSGSLAEEQLTELFETVEMPLIDVLVDMESCGIKVDVERLAELSESYTGRMQALEAEIYELAGRAFNIASPKQLREILFEELGLPVVNRTKTGPSTDADVLEQLASHHPLPAKIVKHRQYAKLLGTYIDALPQLVNPRTDRVHTSFNQVVAATGRLSSNEPNLQNIPIRTAEGREIRSAFRADPADWRLLAADYSQIELRVLAHFTGDDVLREAFARDEDIHTRVAAQVYNVELADVTAGERRAAKAINFGIIYGQSPFGLAKALDIDKEEAAAFIDAYFSRYPAVDEFMNRVLADCRRNGYVSTILGRRRKITGVRDPAAQGDSRQRNLPERTAINTVIQGSAADLIKLAMLAVHRRMQRESCAARMLLQIHDELIFEAPADELAVLKSLVVEEMSNAHQLDVPLKVDVKIGKTWADC